MALVIEVASFLVLGTWLAASALGQTRHPLCRRMRRWDQAGVIPSWRFFGPNPIQSDPHLLYRDRLSDGAFTPWREIPVRRSRRAWRWLWNPGRRQEKALADAQKMLLRQARDSSDLASLQLSLPYLLLLKLVSDLPRLETPEGTQFVLLSSRGERSPEEPRVLFLSNLHPLDLEP